jgi:hypothetical protein
MATQSKLAFLTNEAGEDEGLNDAGVETFKDTPYASVARECGQNSLDAILKKPVIMRLDLLKVPLEEFPNLSTYKAVIAACKKKANGKKDEKEIEFFQRATAILNGKQIYILRISDENTKGLVGPCVEGRPFHSLVKSTGISNKESSTSAGSFGIGKNAAFACSELRTVFYSTVYEDPISKKIQFLAQGKSLLISHVDESGADRRARGYWGGEKFLPIGNKGDVPSWMRRDGIGTSVFAAGFVMSPQWVHKIAASVLRNFFCALESGEIQFVLNEGEIIIDRSTIKVLFQDPKIVEAARESNQIEDFQLSRDLFECVISHQSVRKVLSIVGMGQVEIKILLREGLPKRVYIVRNGMLICDNLKNFGEKFLNFPMYKDFVAVVQPLEKEGSALIKRLENPKHDELSAERIPDTNKREDANRTIKKLAKEIREAIRKEAVTKPDNETTLDELSEFFSDQVLNDAPPNPDSEENPEKYTYTPASPSRREKETASRQNGTEGGAGGNEGKRAGSGAGTGTGSGSGVGGTGQKSNGKPIDLEDVRNVLLDGSSSKRKIFFTPSHSGRAVLSVSATGLQSADPLSIKLSDQGKVVAGTIELDLETGKRTALVVQLAEPYSGPIELQATGVAQGVEP